MRPEYDPVSQTDNFIGWFADDHYQTPWDFDTPITDLTDIYAKWEEKEVYEVSLRYTSKDIRTSSVYEGDTIAKPEQPSIEGYLFDGWRREGDFYEWDFNTPIEADTVLYARWRIIDPSVYPDYPIIDL